ncbi:MAG: hypothetical protein M3081_04745 [Gemmatimonadota bacterium]|nr:hypothetical protein [Gemmatimonadota bacterium]
MGAWHPHLMLVMPYATQQQFGLASPSKVDVISLDHEGTPSAELIVKVPAWADKPAAGAHP